MKYLKDILVAIALLLVGSTGTMAQSSNVTVIQPTQYVDVDENGTVTTPTVTFTGIIGDLNDPQTNPPTGTEVTPSNQNGGSWYWGATR